ncbi:MAG: hypothetical protein CBE00_01540 [Planctomycetaceae bacterium TMED240]|nr:MAG: hypothetical protein CBE00_01540 [Planctomycetaceae bacterium TMED240]
MTISLFSVSLIVRRGGSSMGSKRVAEFTLWLALQRLGVQSCSATRFVIVKGVAKCTPQQSISRFPKWFCVWRHFATCGA